MGTSYWPGISLIFCILLFSQGCHSTRYMGCYRDSDSRLMPNQKNFPGTLTPDVCINHCKSSGFKYAGVQYGSECFCSHDRPSFKHIASAGDCNHKCQGDQGKTCGGGFRLNVYDIYNQAANQVQSSHAGCFADDGNDKRALRGLFVDDKAMTPELCVGYCFKEGYKYAGVQYEHQCFCGDEIQGAQRPENECHLNCAGDKRLKCGGHWRNNVYRTTLSDESPNGRLLGCFVDSSQRLISALMLFLKDNSPKRCMNICLQSGFLYSGVENGNECFCGNKRPDPSKETSESQCRAACSTNGQPACGGGWRIAVYATHGPNYGVQGQSGSNVVQGQSGSNTQVITQVGGTVQTQPGSHKTNVIVVPVTVENSQPAHTGGREVLIYREPARRPSGCRTCRDEELEVELEEDY